MLKSKLIKALPKDKDFRKWFLDNFSKLSKDVANFFKKFSGGELNLESLKSLSSWSVPIPKEYKMELYNMLAELNGQKVLASYGLKNSEFNKILKDAIKENSDIETTDEIKAYIKTNFKEFYDELFKTLTMYEHLGTKSVLPISKMIANNLGAEKGRTVKFSEDLRKYLNVFLKNVIDSINNDMKNYEKPITASTDSVEDTLCSLFNEFSEECHKKANNVLESFSSNGSKLCFDVKISNNLNDYYSINVYWTADGINTSILACKNNECREVKCNHFGITDFTGLKKELYTYLDLVEKEINSEKVTLKLNEEKPKVEVRDIDESDILDICRIILNDNSYSYALKAKANLYLSLYNMKDMNSDYMKTLSDSILASYKNDLSNELKLNSILSSVKNLIETKFNRDRKIYFSTKGENDLLVFVPSNNSFEGEFCIEFVTRDVLYCTLSGMKVLPKPDYDYNERYAIAIEDETTTLTNVECWLIPIFNFGNLVQAAAELEKLSPKPIKDLLESLNLGFTVHSDKDGKSFSIYKINGTNINGMLGKTHFTLNLYYKSKTNTVTLMKDDENKKYTYNRDISKLSELRKLLEDAVEELKNRFK